MNTTSSAKIRNDKEIAPKIDAQLRVLFDNANELKVCMLNGAGRIIGWNISAERLTGYASKEVMGRNYTDFISIEEKRKHIFKRILQIASRRGSYTAEGIRVRKDGSHFWAQTFITPMKDSQGNVKFFILITKDISRERALAQKKEEYIGIASHELRNPITALSLYSELLGKRLEMDADKQNLHMLRDIQAQAKRLTTLIDDLLIVGKIEGGRLELHKEVFNLGAFTKKIISDYQDITPTHKIALMGARARNVCADKSKIAQVLTNILSNAVKYSTGAEKVLVRIGMRKNKHVISIQNFGSDISIKDQKSIFKSFFRTKNAEEGNISGSGLGLYISKEIMKAHHEKLWVESIAGKGTTFFFTLSSA